MLSESNSISRFYSESYTGNDLVSNMFWNSSDDVAEKVRENILETIPAIPDWLSHGVGELYGKFYEIERPKKNNSTQDLHNKESQSDDSFDYCSQKTSSSFDNTKAFGIGADSLDNFEINHLNQKLYKNAEPVRINDSRDENDVYAETARISMRFNKMAPDLSLLEFTPPPYDIKVQEIDQSFADSFQLSKSVQLKKVLDNTPPSRDLANNQRSQVVRQKYVQQNIPIKRGVRKEQQNSRARHNSRDLEKRESHNNMEKMRRRVVAQAFDMVVKAIGVENGRKPSKVTILAMACEFCKNYRGTRELNSAKISQLLGYQRDLINKISSYLEN